MGRLIDADALKQHIDKLPALPDGNFAGNHSALKALINMQLPIDAVPVVRCKDCTHYNAGYECLNEGCGVERDPEWFCADGERKDGEHEKAD